MYGLPWTESMMEWLSSTLLKTDAFQTAELGQIVRHDTVGKRESPQVLVVDPK